MVEGVHVEQRPVTAPLPLIIRHLASQQIKQNKKK
jgi:hypothetical protein